MSFKSQASAVVASGDTTKTSLGTLTIPKLCKRITGIWAYAVGGAGLTTLENVSGIVELESPDINLAPLQLPLDVVTIVTSGSAAFSPRVWNVNIPVSGGEEITAYVTIDMALTIASTCRWGLIYD